MCHLRLKFWLQKLTETLWSLWPVELPGVPLWILFTNKKVIPATGIHFRKVRLAFCRFSCQRTERWQILCSKTLSPGRVTSWQVLLVRHLCSLANASGRVEFYTPARIYKLWPWVDLDSFYGKVKYGKMRVTLISEMDLVMRNGRNGDFFTKWSYKILIWCLIFHYLALIPELDNNQY